MNEKGLVISIRVISALVVCLMSVVWDTPQVLAVEQSLDSSIKHTSEQVIPKVDASPIFMDSQQYGLLANLVHKQPMEAPNTPDACETPEIPQLISPGNNSTIDEKRPRFDWGDVAYATEYRIAVQDKNDAYNYIFEQTPVSEFTPSEDLVDSNYEWLVFATNASEGCYVNGEVSDVWAFTLDTTPTPTCEKPATPQLISPANNSTVQNKRPMFDWGDVAYATEYRIAVQDSNDVHNFIFEQTTASEYTPSIDLVDSDYQWQVFATNAADGCYVHSDLSALWAFTVDTTPVCEKPATPQLISPVNNSTTDKKRPKFDWGGVAYATEYQILIQDDHDAFNYILETTAASEYTPDSDLIDSDYQWLVFASNKSTGCNVQSDLSETWAFTVDATPTCQVPGIPQLISPANNSTTDKKRPKFDWGDVMHATEYRIAIQDKNDAYNFIFEQTPVSEFTPSQDLVDSDYEWLVFATNASSGCFVNGEVSDTWAFIVNAIPPPVPSLISPGNGANISDNTPSFNWVESEESDQYHLQVDNNSTFSSPEIEVAPYFGSYTPSMALADGTYYWRVRAGDFSANWSNWSSVWHFTITSSIQPPATPSLNPINNPNMMSIFTVSWTSVNSATGYEVQERFNSGGWSTISNDASTSIIRSGLSDGQWCYQVRAWNVGGNSNWSNVECTGVDTTPPSAPTLLLPTNGATISDATPNFDWAAAAEATGFRLWVDDSNTFSSPEIIGYPTSSFYTPSAPLADGVYWWKVQARDLAGNWSSWSTAWSFTLKTSATLVADMGFRPYPDGYSFTNYGGVHPEDFTIEDMRKMFGDEVVCNMVGSVCQPLQIAIDWNAQVNEWLSGGRCTGFTVSSLRFFKGYDNPGDLQAGANVPFDISFENGRRHVSYYWVKQVVEPASSAWSHIWGYAPSQVLAELQAAMFNGAPDPVDLILYARGLTMGHSIAPYAIEDRGNGIYWVRVYDNNHPNNFSRYVIINTVNETWSYPTLGWEGDATTRSMGLKPVSVYSQPAICPWCVPTESQAASAMTGQLWLYSQDRVLISDSQGRRIGFVGDEFVNEIPDAKGTVPVGGLGIPMEPIYSLPQNETFSITLSGAAMMTSQILGTGEVQTEEVKISQFGPGYAVTVDNLMVTASSEDQLSIASDGSQVTFEASEAVEPTVRMAMSQSSTHQVFEIRGADIGVGQDLTITSTADEQLVLDNSKTDGGSYDLRISLLNSKGTHTFNHRDIPVTAADTQYVNYSSFEETDTVTLLVDRNSDGTIDETITLENQVFTINLPLVSRR